VQPHEQDRDSSGCLSELRSSSAGLRVDSPWISLRERMDKLMDNSQAGKPAASYPQLDHTNPPPAHTTPEIAGCVESSFQQQ